MAICTSPASRRFIPVICRKYHSVRSRAVRKSPSSLSKSKAKSHIKVMLKILMKLAKYVLAHQTVSSCEFFALDFSCFIIHTQLHNSVILYWDLITLSLFLGGHGTLVQWKGNTVESAQLPHTLYTTLMYDRKLLGEVKNMELLFWFWLVTSLLCTQSQWVLKSLIQSHTCIWKSPSEMTSLGWLCTDIVQFSVNICIRSTTDVRSIRHTIDYRHTHSVFYNSARFVFSHESA